MDDESSRTDSAPRVAPGAPGIPVVHASTIEAGSHFNQFVVQFSEVASSMTPGPEPRVTIGSKPAAVIVLSPQSAKDLLVVLGTVLAQYEAEWGEIDTPYLRGRRQGAI